jgi:hypothetical protein
MALKIICASAPAALSVCVLTVRGRDASDFPARGRAEKIRLVLKEAGVPFTEEHVECVDRDGRACAID